MHTILIIALIAAVVMVMISLIRGIIAFLQSTKLDLEEGNGEANRASEMQLKQNKMMFARIKYQALAVVVVAILLALNS